MTRQHGRLAAGTVTVVSFAALQLVPQPPAHVAPRATPTRAALVPTSVAPTWPTTSVASRGSARALLVPSTRPAPSMITARSGDLAHRIARCESGQNPRAVNRSSGAGGIGQWLPSSWRSMGYAGRFGVSRAEYASAAEQWWALYDALARYGTGPWNASRRCWS